MGELLGYLGMLLAFVMVYLGVRSFRDSLPEGSISFRQALSVGVGIVLVASVIHVVGWMTYHQNFMPDFVDQYVAHSIDELAESGKPAEQIRQEAEQIRAASAFYRNPWVMAGVTFLEIFPVGLVCAVLTAWWFSRRKSKAVQVH